MIKRFVATVLLILPCLVWGQSSLQTISRPFDLKDTEGKEFFGSMDRVTLQGRISGGKLIISNRFLVLGIGREVELRCGGAFTPNQLSIGTQGQFGGICTGTSLGVTVTYTANGYYPNLRLSRGNEHAHQAAFPGSIDLALIPISEKESFFAAKKENVVSSTAEWKRASPSQPKDSLNESFQGGNVIPANPKPQSPGDRLAIDARELERLSAEVRDHERARLIAEAELARRRHQDLELNLADQAKERERQVTELEVERKKRQELETQLAETKEKERQAVEAKERERQQAQVPQVPQPQAAIRNERRVALLVGNGAYKQSPLTNSVNDAVDLNASLKNLGFQTLLVQNASLATMRQKTREFAELALNADVALIFFSGHGIEYRGNNYLIPTSAGSLKEFEVEDETFNVARWMDMLETQKGANKQRVNIVILDACRDNAFSRGWRNTNRGLARMDAPSGTILAYATAPGKLASDGSAGDRNSPYTKNLLRAIQQPNVPVEQVFKDVRRMVVEQTKGEQVPWENSSLIGNFVFKR